MRSRLCKPALPIAALLLAMLPALLALAFVALRGLPVPVGDQWWDTVHVAIKTRQGQLSVADLFAYFEGHRPVVIRVIAALAASAFSYSPAILNYITWIASTINLLLASVLFLRSEKQGVSLTKESKAAAIVLFSVILYTLYHQQSWIDFYFATWQLSLMWVLLAAILIDRVAGGWLSLIVLIMLACLASLTIGLGLSAWLAIPVIAFGNKNYRRPAYLAIWIGAAIAFILFYTSSYSTPLDGPQKALALHSGTTGIQPLSLESLFSLIRIAKQAVQPGIYYISRRFIGSNWSRFTFWSSVIISLLSMLVFSYATIRLWQLGFRKSVVQWAGIASYSLLGSILVFISRRNIMPAERHSPGSDGFWIAVVALSILYMSHVKRNKSARSPIHLPMSILFLFTLAGITFLSLQRSFRAFIEPSTFPRSCADCTQSYPLRRDFCFRKCFVFGDERSTYQLVLMKMGGMGRTKLPERINTVGMQVIAIMPSTLMNEYVKQYVLADSSPSDILSYSPLHEKLIAPLITSPYTASMDWSAKESGRNATVTIKSTDELGALIENSKANSQFRQGVLLFYAAEMADTAQHFEDSLKLAGFREVSNPSLVEASKNFPSLIAKCFEPKPRQEPQYSICKAREF